MTRYGWVNARGEQLAQWTIYGRLLAAAYLCPQIEERGSPVRYDGILPLQACSRFDGHNLTRNSNRALPLLTVTFWKFSTEYGARVLNNVNERGGWRGFLLKIRFWSFYVGGARRRTGNFNRRILLVLPKSYWTQVKENILELGRIWFLGKMEAGYHCAVSNLRGIGENRGNTWKSVLPRRKGTENASVWTRKL